VATAIATTESNNEVISASSANDIFVVVAGNYVNSEVDERNVMSESRLVCGRSMRPKAAAKVVLMAHRILRASTVFDDHWTSLNKTLSMYPNRSKTLSYAMSHSGKEFPRLPLIEVKCGFCPVMTCIGAGYCREHLQQHLQLRIVRSRKNGGNAGLTVEAYNLDKHRKGEYVFLQDERLFPYAGLLLEIEAGSSIYGNNGACWEYALEHSVQLKDGSCCAHTDIDFSDKEDRALVKANLVMDGAIFRSVGSLLNDERNDPTCYVKHDPESDLDWFHAKRNISMFTEMDFKYVDRKDSDSNNNYVHGNGVGKTYGLCYEDYPIAGDRSELLRREFSEVVCVSSSEVSDLPYGSHSGVAVLAHPLEVSEVAHTNVPQDGLRAASDIRNFFKKGGNG